MRRRSIILCVILLIIGIAFVVELSHSLRNIRLRRAYYELKYGDTKDLVVVKMGKPDLIGPGGDVIFWDYEVQKNSKDIISYELKYVVRNFGLDGSIDLGFDTRDRLISKHEFR